MEDKIRNAFDSLRAPERMKRTAKAHIRRRTFDFCRDRQARHRAGQQLLQQDPEITPQQVLKLDMAEIWEILEFQKLDDPCGEQKREE